MLSLSVLSTCLIVCLAKTSLQGGIKPQMNGGMRSMYQPSMLRGLKPQMNGGRGPMYQPSMLRGMGMGNGMMAAGVRKPGKMLGGLQNGMGMGAGAKPGKAGLQSYGMQPGYGMGYPTNGGYPIGGLPMAGYQRGIQDGRFGAQPEMGMTPQIVPRKLGQAGYQNGGEYPRNGMAPQAFGNGYGNGYGGYPGLSIQTGYENGFGGQMYPGGAPRPQPGYGNGFPSAMADGVGFAGKGGKGIGAQPPFDMGAGIMRGLTDPTAAKYGNGGNVFGYLGAGGPRGAKERKYPMNGFFGNGYRGGCLGGKCPGAGKK